MNNSQSSNQQETWQSGYISNNTQLNEIDLSKCDKSKIQVYSHPTPVKSTNK